MTAPNDDWKHVGIVSTKIDTYLFSKESQFEGDYNVSTSLDVESSITLTLV